jgi:isoquinoline 1-oxidoreductase beta subunit
LFQVLNEKRKLAQRRHRRPLARLPFHVAMEPPSATVRITTGPSKQTVGEAVMQMAGTKCEAWACVQSPGNTREELAKKLGLHEDDVTVHVTLLGGGFGRKSQCDFVLEAAVCSQAMGGAPVKVIWTREDDLQHDYLHTVSAERIDAGLDEPHAELERRFVCLIGLKYR